ncbi:TPA: toxin co-regulated pilus biosynthesis Q family protein [Burkholderia vietnamiensis]|uniref:toxin co-regulated pilus biosynthesis Q family protein n=1 Tax=Burkholderia vietnamiensis TaxID=60552 RepID=UPI0015943DFE|nr:toxin co-regulated pilus biosynthesis Q family protein [Burkholderia vietnamiensis]MCA8210174.1 toxin co-regulated pilus biosynthesis Q family protein [Burkholderia vietnamiensis]HDR9101283.1 toxin co-regulated pilus biosynthesis Q family protein [Burkholderia vietnamiensis]HDR9121028.1 toxin co-regulated pilus biosynthesis Q family protein [Burkholderia vietnamiensis]
MNSALRSLVIFFGVLSWSAAVAAAEVGRAGPSSVVHIAPYRGAAVRGAELNAPTDGVSTTTSTAPIEVPIGVATPDKGTEAFALVAGKSIQSQLQSWAVRAGWTVVWDVQQDWIVPNAATFAGDFVSAAQQVVEALASNGADVRADLYTGNRSMVVHQAGNE